MADATVYIDGFNVFYGVFKHPDYSKYKWTDITKYCSRLLPNDNILKIYYFTALLPSWRVKKNQLPYINALRTLSKVEVVLGRFTTHYRSCKVKACEHPGSKIYQNLEEKRTDVSIALKMSHDFLEKKSQKLVLLTNDSDLIPVIQYIKMRRNKLEPDDIRKKARLVVYNPAVVKKGRFSRELAKRADEAYWLPLDILVGSELKNPVIDADGNKIYKPKHW